ncbi:MAG: diacylglycerol O-acyltransferase / wax synthase [Thermoleophilaceae bacterium]|jgi:WS/DGAT/MGAT family acyltransferase|nr:diacylglycerol O-acyltransferase / wax synthase [Thermoleophilaceae bacterium]
MHVGGVLIFDGVVTREEIVRRLRERIHLIPRYAMRIDEAPLGIANPVWVQDDNFDPDRHVRRVALPAPGGREQLEELVGDLMSDRLDRTRPLWQIQVVEGLEGGRTGLVARMHHALVDGIAAVDVSTVVLDPTPEPLEIDAPPATVAAGRVSSLAGMTAARLHVPRKLARDMATRALALEPRATARQIKSAAGVVGELTRIRPTAPDTRLNQSIGPDRLFAMARGALDEVKAVRRATGATVNDVLLTAVALMLSDFLEEPPDHVVALVPVSVRTEDERGELGNHISTVFVDLPLTGEPLERLARVSEAMNAVKASAQVRAGALIVGATGLAPPLVSSLAVRAMSGPRMFNLVVSNVPGPQQTFYVAGVPVREVYPAVPLNPRNQAMTVGILSYDGGVHFGLLADRDSVPDVADAALGLERALSVLTERAR